MGGSRVTNAAAALIGRGVARTSRAIGGAVTGIVAGRATEANRLAREIVENRTQMGIFAQRGTKNLRSNMSDSMKSESTDNLNRAIAKLTNDSSKKEQRLKNLLGNREYTRQQNQKKSRGEKMMESRDNNRIDAFYKEAAKFNRGKIR